MKSAAHKPTGLVPINRRQSFALSSRSNSRVGGPLSSSVSSLLRELKSPVVALLSTFEILRDCAGERNTFHLRTVLQTEAPQIVLGLCLAAVHLEGDIFINLLVSNQFQTLVFFVLLSLSRVLCLSAPSTRRTAHARVALSYRELLSTTDRYLDAI